MIFVVCLTFAIKTTLLLSEKWNFFFLPASAGHVPDANEKGWITHTREFAAGGEFYIWNIKFF